LGQHTEATVLTASDARSACGDHQVEFYDDDATLIDSVVRFLRPGIEGGAAVVVGTPDHRRALLEALRDEGVDAAAAVTSGRLRMLDAEETLAELLEQGIPREARFAAVIGPVLDRALTLGGPVRVFGEMVAVLWEEGAVGAAMVLEKLWNEIGPAEDFDLLCGYPAALFAQGEHGSLLDSICAEHTTAVLAPTLQWWPEVVRSGRAEGPGVRWELPARWSSGALARARLRELLGRWELADVLGEAELLVTELVSNAILHGRSDVSVRLSRTATSLHVEVTDRGAVPLLPVEGPLDATHGRGLMLVDRLSSAWGTASGEDRKTVWFDLGIPAA
jgi:anti-sigma regulatory factor (Ser/Thr protein kinase)